MIKEGKDNEEIINTIISGLNNIIKKNSSKFENTIKVFNKNHQDLIEDINKMSSLFNQLQLEKKEEFKNNFNQLIRAGKGIKIDENTEESFLTSIFQTLSYIWNSFKSIFNIFKS